MKLYFLRHGKADWPDWDRPDDERPLTKKGRHEMRRIAKFLAKSKVKPGALLSSPLPRASETAEIAAKALGLDVQLDRALGLRFNLAKLRPLLEQSGGEDLMIVGHDPGFTTVVKALTGADLKLGKGGLARVDLEKPESAKGRLIWLIPPKVGRA
ncbi:MAG: histidine phosphatase family protein [Chthoniobacterales bacterium]